MDVVNENNEIIGQDRRNNIHMKGLWHRGVHVLVFNVNGKILLQKRSPNKDKFPSCYDISLSEHLQSGENYEQAALRGLEEELGITDVTLEKLVRFRMIYGHNDNNISEIFRCKYDDKVKIDRNEINEIEFMPLNKVMELIRENENIFAFWANEILKWFFGMTSKLEKIK